MKLREGVSWPQLSCSLQQSDRFLGAPTIESDAAQYVERRRVAGIQGESLASGALGLMRWSDERSRTLRTVASS